MTTADEIVEGALIEVADFGDNFPSSRPAMYRRINKRQQELFSWAGTIDYNYYGVCAIGDVINGGVDILKITGEEPTIPPSVESLNKVEVWTVSVSEFERGDPVHVVNMLDTDMADPPRVVVRDGVIWQVENDLEGISQIRIHYSKRSRPIKDGTSAIELPDSYSDLLVYDLAKSLIERTVGITKETRETAVAYFEKQEQEMLGNFEQHIRNYSPMETRFQFNPTNAAGGSRV